MRILWFVANLEYRKAVLHSPVPSIRIRCLLPAKTLMARHPDWQIHVVDLGQVQPGDFAQFETADIAVFGKVFYDHQLLYEYLTAQKIPIVMDLCDDIFHRQHLSEAYQLLMRYATKTVVSCTALAEQYRTHRQDHATVILDGVEGQRYNPVNPTLGHQRQLRCLWYGVPHNLNFLIFDLPNFAKLASYKIHLTILTQMDDEVRSWFESAKTKYSPALTLEVLQWNPDEQNSALQQCDVVLVPSAQGEAFRVKTANRVITALWAGKPCVAYPLPSYQEFEQYIPLKKSMVEGLQALLKTPVEMMNRQIKAAQTFIAQQYCPQKIACGWEAVFEEVSESPEQSPAQTVALNLGCGDKILPGYVNVDLVDQRAGSRPDVVCDIRKLAVFEDNYADEILSVHVIEHFYQWEAKEVLLEWVRVLKPGGRMVVECPNLLTACEEVLKDPEHSTGPGVEGQRTMWVLYGDPAWKDPLMCHKWLYTPASLGRLMQECGLEKVDIDVAQFKLGPPRDMRLVGYKSAAVEIATSSASDAAANAQSANEGQAGHLSLTDMIGAVGDRA